MTKLHVNGKQYSYDGDGDMPLMWYLRDIVGLTGTKFGCGGGHCGACTVHVDGVAVRSCQTPIESIDKDAKISTIEGLGADGLHALQKAWADNDVPQCGYCQSGQIMQAASLLEEKPNPTDAEIDDAMYGNICRCGTYQRIKKAIRQVVAQNQGGGK